MSIVLHHADCFDVFPSLKEVDLVLVDLPYGTTEEIWDISFNLDLMWSYLNNLIKKNAALLFFSSQPFSSKLVFSTSSCYRYSYIWNKNFGSNFANVNKIPLKVHEEILVFYKKFPTYNKQMTLREKVLDCSNWKNDKKLSKVNAARLKNLQGTNKIYSEKNPTSILNYSSVANECNNTKRVHPSQKPIALLEFLIKTYSNEGETVLDFTMGSGSTGVACKNTNRNFIGIEKELKYFEIAKQRLEIV